MHLNLTALAKRLFLKFSLVLLFAGYVVAGSAQPALPAFVNSTTPGMVDYTVPADIGRMYITIGGGQGGSVISPCPYVGGEGLLYKFELSVGYCDIYQIVPGGTLRLITGGRGESANNPSAIAGGGGGGGGSALLYKAPSSSVWNIIAVAGGGGGAGARDFLGACDGQNGFTAPNSEEGSNGGSGTGCFGGAGGANGGGGGEGGGIGGPFFGGGGAYGDGITSASQNCNGKRGYPGGADGGGGNCFTSFNYRGGFGFGSGGAGTSGGGGGGGYSGGGGGGCPKAGGGGGGSYYNFPWMSEMSPIKINGVRVNNLGDGKIIILCANGTLVPPVSLASTTLPALQVTGCNVNNNTGFGFSTSATTITLAQFNAAGGNIVAGGCSVFTVNYIDTLDPVTPATKVNRTYRVIDFGDNTAIAKKVITIVNPGIAATISPATQLNCINTPLSTITVNVLSQFGITIQWYKGENPVFPQAEIIPGAISSDYTPPATGVPGLIYYFARITDGCGVSTNKIATVDVISQPITWYKDSDNDNYSDPLYFGQPTCVKPGPNFKTSVLGTDCDDNDATYNPQTIWVHDADGDGFYSGSPYTGCLFIGATGYVRKTTQLPGDCNDNNSQVYPGKPEICNGIDDDCDGLTDVFCCPPSGIIYVKANASGGNNGTSWANAYKFLADGLEAARRCSTATQIWVAAGTYYPDEGATAIANDRASTFSGRNKLAVYGGFSGTETLLSQRNLGAGNISILNGDIMQNNVATNKCYHVVRLDDMDSTFLLDGFTIKNGNASAPGGPIHQIFGGGMLVLDGNPAIRNCYITNNSSSNGDGVANLGTRAVFYNCVITGNTSPAGTGGAVHNTNSEPWFIHCTIANNHIGTNVFHNPGSSPRIYNSIIRGASPAITGEGSPFVEHSIIQNATSWAGTGNSNADPLFLNEAAGNLRLTACSPAVNNALIYSFSPFIDIEGRPRTISANPDMGAYERSSVEVLYVDSSAVGSGDGSSWANAITSLQTALQLNCSAVNQIWVANGTYKPTTGVERTASFGMRNNLAIYGGFAGTETLLTARNWNTNLTILSGDIGTPNNNTDNTYSIFANTSIEATAVLDGFTITGGNSNTNGGAMKNNSASATIQNCIFRNNIAASFGGAIHNTSSNPRFTNCLFTGNSATNGGGVFNTGSSPEFINCTMSGNTSPSGSFAWSQTNSLVDVTNCILWGNTGSAALVNTVTSPYTVSYSVVQESTPGTGNLNVNPQFIDSSRANFSLLSCSPAVNAGTNAALTPGVTKDLAGATRIALTTIDMGAYERQTIEQLSIIYVDAAATGKGDGSSWANACTELTTALNNIRLCGTATTIQIATGTYNAPTFSFNKQNAIILGGYPHGGGVRNPVANPVVLKGNVQVLKPLQMEGLRFENP